MENLNHKTEFVEFVARIMSINMDDILCLAQTRKPGREDYLACNIKIITKDGGSHGIDSHA